MGNKELRIIDNMRNATLDELDAIRNTIAEKKDLLSTAIKVCRIELEKMEFNSDMDHLIRHQLQSKVESLVTKLEALIIEESVMFNVLEEIDSRITDNPTELQNGSEVQKELVQQLKNSGVDKELSFQTIFTFLKLTLQNENAFVRQIGSNVAANMIFFLILYGLSEAGMDFNSIPDTSLWIIPIEKKDKED